MLRLFSSASEFLSAFISDGYAILNEFVSAILFANRFSKFLTVRYTVASAFVTSIARSGKDHDGGGDYVDCFHRYKRNSNNSNLQHGA